MTLIDAATATQFAIAGEIAKTRGPEIAQEYINLVDQAAGNTTAVASESATFLGLTGMGWSMGISAIGDIWCSEIARQAAKEVASIQKDTIRIEKDSQISSIRHQEKLTNMAANSKVQDAKHERKCIAAREKGFEKLAESEKKLAQSQARISVADARFENAEKVKAQSSINESKLREMFDHRGQYNYGNAKTNANPNLKPTVA